MSLRHDEANFGIGTLAPRGWRSTIEADAGLEEKKKKKEEK
jgi:hypothetical protein